MQSYAAETTYFDKFTPEWVLNLPQGEREKRAYEFAVWISAYPDKMHGDPDSTYWKPWNIICFLGHFLMYKSDKVHDKLYIHEFVTFWVPILPNSYLLPTGTDGHLVWWSSKKQEAPRFAPNLYFVRPFNISNIGFSGNMTFPK